MNKKEKIRDIVAEISNIDISILKDETPVMELGLDSLDLAQIVFNIEEELNTKISGDIELEDMLKFSVGDFLDMLTAKS